MKPSGDRKLTRHRYDYKRNQSMGVDRSLSWLTGEHSSLDHPADISEPGAGGKFDFTGAVLPYPGNTFICHIDQSSYFYRSLCDLQDAIRALPNADCMTFLPKKSFHMTVFCGVGGVPLNADGWPSGIEASATLDNINNFWCDRLQSLGKLGGFVVKPDSLRAPYSVRMCPGTDDAASALIHARTCLETFTGIVRGDLHCYEFHITLGYLLRWMTDEDAETLIAQSNRLYSHHLSGFDSITLGALEFCTFENMHQFNRMRLFEE